VFRTAVSTVLLAIVCTGALDRANAQTRVRESLVVRAYNTYGVGAGTLRAATAGGVATFDTTGIDVQWTECRTRRSAQSLAPCDQAVRPREVVLRIVGTPRTEGDPNVLGFSYVDQAARRGTLSTVYMDRVSDVARRLHVEEGQMLGYAIAHEVAHLLLGTPTHSARGIMRDRWLQGHNEPADWMFSEGEAAVMRAALMDLPNESRMASR